MDEVYGLFECGVGVLLEVVCDDGFGVLFACSCGVDACGVVVPGVVVADWVDACF